MVSLQCAHHFGTAGAGAGVGAFGGDTGVVLGLAGFGAGADFEAGALAGAFGALTGDTGCAATTDRTGVGGGIGGGTYGRAIDAPTEGAGVRATPGFTVSVTTVSPMDAASSFFEKTSHALTPTIATIMA